MIRILLTLAFLLVVSSQTLSQIKDNISQSKRINVQSIGSRLTGYLNISLHQYDFPAANITFNLTPTQLTVICDSVVFGAQVDLTLYIFYVGSDLELAFTFDVIGSITLRQLYQLVNKGLAVPSFFNDIKSSGKFDISFSSSSSAPVPIAKGLTIQGTADIVNGTLLSVLHSIKPSITHLDVGASLFIPLFSSDPQDVSIKLSSTGAVALTNTLTAESLSLTVDVPTDIEIDMDLQATLNPSKAPNVLQFQLSGQYLTNQKQLTLQGDMSGTWVHPLGLNWLSINSAKGTLIIANGNSLQFSIVAQSTLSFASSPVTVDISVSGPNSENILFEVDNIPVSKTIQNIFKDISGILNSGLSQVTISGTGTLAISTYDTGKFREGVTFDINAAVTEGEMLKAVKVLKPDATPSTFNYVGELYVSLFGQDSEAELSLKETGSFEITKHTLCEDFSLDYDISSDSKIDITADLQTTVADGQNLKFTVSGDFDSQSEEVQFSGKLDNQWVHPFHLSWLTLDAADVAFTLGGTEDFQISISGSASLSFVQTGPVSVAAAVGGEDLSDVYFTVSGIPISKSILSDVCKAVLKLTDTPPEITSMSATGTASIAVSTYDAPQARKGFSFEADITIQETSSDLYKLLHFFVSDPSTLSLSLNLFSPIFDPTPSLSLSLSANGAIHLTKSITSTSLQISVTIGTPSSISLSTALSVSFNRQSSPLLFNIQTSFTSSSPTLSLSGNMAGTWNDPFGIKWLSLSSVSISLVLGAPAGINSLSLSASGSYHFSQDTGTASVSFSVSDDFMDVSFTATLNNQWTFKQIAETIIDSSKVPSFADDVETSSTSLSITVATTSGVSFDIHGSVVSDLASDIKKYAYWWSKDLSGLQYDIKASFPIFSTNPADISLALMWSEEIKLTDHLWFESVTFDVDAVPFSIGLDAKIKAAFKNNPVIYFEASGSYKSDGSVLLWGAMEGTWVNPFGIHGFDLSNVIVEFGFNPELCALDGCISDFGLGAEMAIGHKLIKFDGNVAAPDFWDVFFSGSITESSNSLAVVDVINEWNKVNPSTPVSTQNIASTWGITECSFYFAPEDGTFGPIHYTQGFGVTGDITIFSMDLFLSLNCTDSMGFSCNFAFDVHFSLGQFADMIKKELGLYYGNDAKLKIFSVSQVTLSEWSQKESSSGVHPRFNIGITILGSDHNLDFRMPQDELQQSFHDFFKTWLKHLFD